MNKHRWKTAYLIFSFLLSVYLAVITVLGFTSLSKVLLHPWERAGHYILWFFVGELAVMLLLSRDVKKFWKEQWISVVAVAVSLSVTQWLDVVAGIGSLTGLKALKGVKALKTLKSLKSAKVFKFAKGAKVAKSVKLGKKANKAVRTLRAGEPPAGAAAAEPDAK